MDRDRGSVPSGQPLAYFITFRCYGTWLPGDERGWVDRRHNQFGTDIRRGHSGFLATSTAAMTWQPFHLDSQPRAIVDSTILETFAHTEDGFSTRSTFAQIMCIWM